MKKLLAAMTVIMLLPTTTLASSIRHGSKPKPRVPKGPTCLVEDKWEKCKVTIDETGVDHPTGKITNVVQWTTDAKPFNTGGAIVGGAVGTGVGFAAGLGSCFIAGPFCLITAPAIMSTGTDVGVGAGGRGTGRFFTVVGDDEDGNRLIQEFFIKSGKTVRQESKQLLKTTGLAESEVRK